MRALICDAVLRINVRDVAPMRGPRSLACATATATR
jgi:hypothetical protein